MSRVVTFPDGTRIRAGRMADATHDARDRPPDLGVYAHGSGRPRPTRLGRALNRLIGRPLHAGSWTPAWDVAWVEWPDMGVPAHDETAALAIESAFARARAGELVEVRCLGGVGRTGTMLACMAVLAGVPADAAVAWVRAAYRARAVERPAQAAWVQRFAERRVPSGDPAP
jgi:hypothetical protein